MRATLLSLLLLSVAHAREFGKGPYVSHVFPPQKPDPVPIFTVPRDGETLDDGWSFVQALYDADTTNPAYPSYLNAVPVGLGFTRQGRGYLAVLHTVFRTTNGGRSWQNMDPYPPPSGFSSDWVALRMPTYISHLSARPVLRDSVRYDTVLFSTISSTLDTGTLRLIYDFFGVRLYALPVLRASSWLTLVNVADSVTACAIAGLDGELYHNDSLWLSTQWERLNSNKVLIRSGRQDSLNFEDTWMSDVCSASPLIIAVGSHHWISRDRGARWQIRPPADSLFDNSVSFADTSYGMTAGGTIGPQWRGWVHRTTDGGRTWSGRILQTDRPLRTIKMVTRDLAFVAGGVFDEPSGEIWMTTDGGQSWQLDLSTAAEIRCLETVRTSTAFVDLFAAGAFPDFRGGVWRKRIYLPDTSGAVFVIEPDTLDFGDLPASIADTLAATVRNLGTQTDTIFGYTGATTAFQVVPYGLWLVLEPGEEQEISIAFRSQTLGLFATTIQFQTGHSGPLDLVCRARVPVETELPPRTLLPSDARLTVWPNPGNATFEVRFELSRAAVAAVHVFDLAGRHVETLAEASFAPGEFTRTWDAANRATGIYFIRLDVAGAGSVTQKVLLVK